MTGLISYFTALTTTALIGVLVTSLVKDQRIQSILQIIMGILILLVLLKPVASIQIDKLGQELEKIIQEEFQTADYETIYQDKLQKQVKKVTEDYVIKQAESIGARISVEVEVLQDGYPIPESIRITGALTMDQKRNLQDYITGELGIPLENQRWDLHE